MQVLPIDVVALAGVIVGGLVVIIPIVGFTTRFALKPIVEAIARTREQQNGARELALMDQRVALLEQQIQAMDVNLERLVEKKEFDRHLTVGDES